ncbi:MAG: hypothetical protein SCALA701_35160 [Candidatus Scalindua sp.]|nr:MAG: hypothetical protein SCALA701_35160 [Candidatus Scalindua sp.]
MKKVKKGNEGRAGNQYLVSGLSAVRQPPSEWLTGRAGDALSGGDG